MKLRTVITCVHTCHLWDSHVFTLFVCGMQRIHKHKKVGCALTESLIHAQRWKAPLLFCVDSFFVQAVIQFR